MSTETKSAPKVYEGKNSIFATRLRGLIAEKKVNNTTISNVLGISRQAIGQYTDGISQATVEKVAKLAEYFGVSADYLIGLSDIRSSNVDDKKINELLGLSQEAIESLKLARLFHPVETKEGKSLRQRLTDRQYKVLGGDAVNDNPALTLASIESSASVINTINMLLGERLESLALKGHRVLDVLDAYLTFATEKDPTNKKGGYLELKESLGAERMESVLLVDVQRALVRLKNK